MIRDRGCVSSAAPSQSHGAQDTRLISLPSFGSAARVDLEAEGRGGGGGRGRLLPLQRLWSARAPHHVEEDGG